MAALAKTSQPSAGPELDNRRVAASLIDLLVPLAGVAVVFAAGLSFTLGLLLVVVGWTLFYFFALESGDGQTLGKRVMNLRVVSADGSPASMEQIAKRTIVRILDGHIVGLIVMLATGDRRLRLGDIVAGTVVTDAERAPGVSEAATTHLAAVPAHLGPAPGPGLLERKASKPAGAKPPFFKRELALPSFSRSSKPKPAAVVPAPAPQGVAKPSFFKRDLALPSFGKPSFSKPSLPKRDLSRPSFGGSRKSKAVKAPKPPKAPSDVAKPSLLKRELSLPSFGKKSRRRAGEVSGPAVTQTDGPAPGPVAKPSVPEPASALPDPVPPVQNDRLSDALRAAAAPEAPEPLVEFDRPEPTVEFDGSGAWDLADEPDPIADLGGREPVVEMDQPEPEAEPEIHAPEPEAPSRDEGDTGLTIKPIETVSAIDLVMQDAEERRPAGR